MAEELHWIESMTSREAVVVPYRSFALWSRLTVLGRMSARLSVWLYSFRLGWLLGPRAILLTHRDRGSGELRRSVLYSIGLDPATGGHIVCSAFGTRSEWLQNVEREPRVIIKVQSRLLAARATRLSWPAAARELFDFSQRDPAAFRKLMRRRTGRNLDATPKLCRSVARWIPVVALQPHETVRADRGERSGYHGAHAAVLARSQFARPEAGSGLSSNSTSGSACTRDERARRVRGRVGAQSSEPTSPKLFVGGGSRYAGDEDREVSRS